MTVKPAWKEEARRLIDGGMPVAQAAREVGMSEHAVRFGLDINNCKARTYERTRKRRQRLREQPGSVIQTRSPRHHVTSKQGPKLPDPVEDVVEAPSARSSITLPKISIPALDDEPRLFRLVPQVRTGNSKPGVERIRRIHLAMARAGKLRFPDLVEEMRQ